MIRLSEIGEKLNDQDKIRRNQMRKHPKYEPGFEEENRDDTKIWMEDKEMRGLLVQSEQSNIRK